MAFHQLEDFRHKKLTSPDRQIRLLSIIPSSDGGKPMYSLQTHLLNARKRPPFYAVSYEWGSSKRIHDIVIDGKRFVIRSNIRRFLRRIGNADEAFIRPVWIDAICIDQSDVSERNAQVGIMGEIFSAAELVLTWLGTNHDGVGTLTETTSKLEEWQGSRGWTSFLDRAHNNSSRLGASQETALPALFSLQAPLGAMWICIRLLCEQTYWTRLWIVQELVKAKKLLLMWGDEEISWDTLSIAFNTIQLAYRTASSSQHDANPWALVRRSIPYKVWQHTQNLHYHQRSLLETMEMYRTSRCSIPHDKAYALTGISADATLLPVDYETSLPDLYVNLMELLPDSRHCIRYSHLILDALQVNEWSLISGGGISSSLKNHSITCEAEHVGYVSAVKPVAIHEIAEMVEAEVLEMLVHAKVHLTSDDAITRIMQWVKITHEAFQATYRNDINQVAFFAMSNGQIGVTKSVILVGDLVCSLPSHLEDNKKVYLRVASNDDISEDGHSARGGYESPQLSSPTQSSFLSDLSSEMVTRVWLLFADEPASSPVRCSRQASATKASIQISYDALVALQTSLGFELLAPTPASSAASSPTTRRAHLDRPICRSPLNDPIASLVDQTLKKAPGIPSGSFAASSFPSSSFEKRMPRRQSGQAYVDAISRQLRELMSDPNESSLNSPD